MGIGSNSFSEAQALFQNAADRAFSPRLGAVVQPTSWLSFYGNYSESFGITNARPAPG